RRVAASDEPYITLRLLVPGIRVRESSWIPIELRDAVLDRTRQNGDVTQPREVEGLGVIAPELAGRDVIVGPERNSVEIHPQPSAGVRRHERLLRTQLPRTTLGESFRPCDASLGPFHIRRSSLTGWDEHPDPRLADSMPSRLLPFAEPRLHLR